MAKGSRKIEQPSCFLGRSRVHETTLCVFAIVSEDAAALGTGRSYWVHTIRSGDAGPGLAADVGLLVVLVVLAVLALVGGVAVCRGVPRGVESGSERIQSAV